MTNRIEANLHSGHIVDMKVDATVTAIGDLVTVDGGGTCQKRQAGQDIFGMVGRLWTHKGETRAVIVRDGAFAIPELQSLHDITIDDGGNIIIDPTDPGKAKFPPPAQGNQQGEIIGNYIGAQAFGEGGIVYMNISNRVGGNLVEYTSFVDAKYGHNDTGMYEEPAKPFQTLQAAIDSLPNGQGTVVIREGNYYENTQLLPNSNITFNAEDGVVMDGGRMDIQEGASVIWNGGQFIGNQAGTGPFVTFNNSSVTVDAISWKPSANNTRFVRLYSNNDTSTPGATGQGVNINVKLRDVMQTPGSHLFAGNGTRGSEQEGLNLHFEIDTLTTNGGTILTSLLQNSTINGKIKTYKGEVRNHLLTATHYGAPKSSVNNDITLEIDTFNVSTGGGDPSIVYVRRNDNSIQNRVSIDIDTIGVATGESIRVLNGSIIQGLANVNIGAMYGTFQSGQPAVNIKGQESEVHVKVNSANIQHNDYLVDVTGDSAKATINIDKIETTGGIYRSGGASSWLSKSAINIKGQYHLSSGQCLYRIVGQPGSTDPLDRNHIIIDVREAKNTYPTQPTGTSGYGITNSHIFCYVHGAKVDIYNGVWTSDNGQLLCLDQNASADAPNVVWDNVVNIHGTKMFRLSDTTTTNQYRGILGVNGGSNLNTGNTYINFYNTPCFYKDNGTNQVFYTTNGNSLAGRLFFRAFNTAMTSNLNLTLAQGTHDNTFIL